MATTTPEWRHLRLDDGWDDQPEPDSPGDVDQAIAAKLHIGLRLPTVLAEARHTWVEPALVAGLPEWPDDVAPWRYGIEAHLPASTLYLDFEGEDGAAASWPEPTWPLEFHLRGAVCWAADGVWSMVPIGSVGGRNPFGGTDYEPWARVVFAPGEGPYPDPGPGDVVVRGDDAIDSWVDMEGGSLCAHRLSIVLNLAARVLRVLWLVEATGAELAAPALPRPERRRAARAGRRISDVLEGLPKPLVEAAADADEDDEAFDTPCSIPNTHARLEQAHILWHEALEAYHDEAQFLRKLNPLIESLRTVTMVLQKEIDPLGPDIARWYGKWQQRMGKDPKMTWVKDRRNEVVHEGHIEKHSKARLSIVGPQITAQPVEMDVDPSTSAQDLVRRVQLGGLDRRVREDGLLVIERRWTVEPFEDDELLDILAHCFGMLLQIVSEAHVRLGGDLASCEANEDALHPIDLDLSARTGRPPCMWAGRQARTSRRDLESGAPTGLLVRESHVAAADMSDVIERYGPQPTHLCDAATPWVIADRLHDHARRIFAVDGRHDNVAWLVRNGRIIDQVVLNASSRSDRYMMLERVGDDAARLAAEAVVVTNEAWRAVALSADDPRATQSATEREDRGEALVTQLVLPDGTVEAWTSGIDRNNGTITLEDIGHEKIKTAPVFAALISAWADGRRT